MAVYHGTLAGEEILESGYINTTSKENSVYGTNEDLDGNLSLKTSEGYVYLALEEEKACEFCFSSMVHQQKALTGGTIYIFEVDVNGLEFYPDYDEVGTMDIKLSDAMRETRTFAVKDSLEIGERVKRYKKIKVKNSQELSDIIDLGKLRMYEWTDLD